MDISKALTLAAHGLQVRDDRLRTVAATLATPAAPVSPLLAGPHRWEARDAEIQPDGGRHAGAAQPAPRPGIPRAAVRSQGAALRPGMGDPAEKGDERRAYDANLDALSATRSLLTRAIEMLR